MKFNEFLIEIENTYNKHFPNSKCKVELTTNLYPSIYIKCYLANDNKECANNYWVNDMFNITFWIDTETGEFDKSVNLDSEVPSNLQLKCSDKSYLLKPPDKYLAYGRKQLTFRKTVGEYSKILNSLDKFFIKLKEELIKDIEADNIHNNHRKLLLEKLNITE